MVRLTERVELNLGHQCNARCQFCYHLDSVGRRKQASDISTKRAKRNLEYIRKEGFTEVEFTGGEPTLREDISELAAYAKSLGFVNISIITNGIAMQRAVNARRLIDSGINDFIFSIHGHKKDLHDFQTGIPGSFDNIIKAVNNVKMLGARCRSNTVISGLNYKYASKILKFLLTLQLKSIYFVLFKPVAEAKKAKPEVFVKYSDAARFIIEGISMYKDKLPIFCVKYIPFCFLKGYEEYVMNDPQQNYDPDEWNIYMSYKMRLLNQKFIKRKFMMIKSMVMGIRRLKSFSFPLEFSWRNIKTIAVTQCIEQWGKTCLLRCRVCRYYCVCDFILTKYIELFGADEIEPVKGPKVKNPIWCYLGARHRLPGKTVTS